ncbi:hypothetical protein KIPB_005107 [Kipferlia bialata]|uniref:SGNH hydrolase-type esterase domain-containing protein n=1 Tax=Kipferlia bialata TaxID=797122 RepID=A0A9K3GIT2_9EUKA|nr:hypothetical protein KIPB_005107 [Kipferlia bialata]|eukprot:g5107.t1
MLSPEREGERERERTPEHVGETHALTSQENGVVIIWFGANDAALETNKVQHVPVPVYTETLKTMVAHFTEAGVPSDRVVLMSPPPVNDATYMDQFCKPRSIDPVDRTRERTGDYVDACGSVAKELGTRFVHLYKAFAAEQEGLTPDSYNGLFVDGLHLSNRGQKVVSKALSATLKGEGEEQTDISPESMPFWFPHWSTLVAYDAEQ